MDFNLEEDLLERDSSITFFTGPGQQIQNDTKLVDSSKASTLKRISCIEYTLDSETVVSTYENHLIKNANRYIYFFSDSVMYDIDGREEFHSMESPMRNMSIQSIRRER